MTSDRTAATTLRLTAPARSSAPDTPPADGFAALLGAADKAPRHEPGRRADEAARQDSRRRAGKDTDGRERGVHGRRPGGEPAARTEPTAAPDAPVVPTAPGLAGSDLAAATPAPLALPAGPVPAAAAPSASAPVTLPAAPAAPAAPLPAAPAEVAVLGAPVVAPAVVADPVAAADAGTESMPRLAAPAAIAVLGTGTAAAPGSAAQALPTAVPAEATVPVPEAPAQGTPVPQAPTSHEVAPQAVLPGQSGASAGNGNPGEQPSHEQPAFAGAPAAPAPAPVQSAPAEAPAAPAPAPVGSVPAIAPAAPAPVLSTPHSTAPLHEAPRAVAQLLHVAVDRGITHAKLNLRPAELGGIEIRLQTSAAGVTAQVVADSPEAAKLLQQAADDLRRSLERQDVTLLSLDVSTAREDRFGGASGASGEHSESARRQHGADAEAGADEAADAQPPTVTTLELPDGLLVDVLA